MPFPSKAMKYRDEEDFNLFVEMLRPLYLHTPLTKIMKMSPYAK